MEKKCETSGPCLIQPFYRYSQTVSRISQQHLFKIQSISVNVSRVASSRMSMAIFGSTYPNNVLSFCLALFKCEERVYMYREASQPISLCIFLPSPALAPLPFSVPICASSLRFLVQAPFTASLLSALCRSSPPRIRVWTTRTRNTGQIALNDIQKSISRIARASLKVTTFMDKKVCHTTRRV